jgi:hypothetical protein
LVLDSVYGCNSTTAVMRLPKCAAHATTNHAERDCVSGHSSSAAAADCYDCIDNCILVGGKANVCPVCKVLLGPNPWEHGKLRYDFMLDSLVRKVGVMCAVCVARDSVLARARRQAGQAAAGTKSQPTADGACALLAWSVVSC